MATTAGEMVRDAMARIDVVTPEAAAEEIGRAGVVMVDVREPVEWEHHITGSVQVPRGLLEFFADPTSPRHDERLDPAARTIVYCNSGGRGALATETLRALGFTDVANLAGGFTRWRDAGLPTTEHHADL